MHCRLERRWAPAFLPALVLAVVAALPAAAQEPQPAPPAPSEEPAGPAAPYTVTITGIEDGGLSQSLNDASSLVTLQDDPPPSLIGLERRVSQDRDRLNAALRAAGFYDGRIDIAIDDRARPVAVAVSVRTGPLYTFKTVAIRTPTGQSLPIGPVAPADLGLRAGEAARADAVVGAQNALLGRLRERSYGFARVADREVIVDHNTRGMDVTYVVDPGPAVRFGATRIEGIEAVDPALILGRLPWRPGQAFRPELLDKARADIAALGTFSITRVALDGAPEPDGTTPVLITVSERLPRFVGLGINYSTSEGIGGQAYWGHRNLFGGAEQFKVTAEVGRLGGDSGSGTGTLGGTDLTLGVDFRKPDFLSPKQTLLMSFAVKSENPPAYERRAAVFATGLERPLTDTLKLNYGLTVEVGRTETNDRTYKTALLGLPVALAYDGSDSLLNPTTGFRASLEVTPWTPVGGETNDRFVSAKLGGSAYYDVSGGGDYVLAGRAAIGSVVGTGLRDLPPDKRFYTGGGGTVRGFGFQKVGPRDGDGDPTGGRSLFETGLELRIKITESIGIVPFVDAGAVYDSAFPKIGTDLKVGAGLGVRYYTDFGPLRADLGIPLNKEKGDDSWQIYLSLGQAF